jgi:hypothetical protein
LDETISPSKKLRIMQHSCHKLSTKTHTSLIAGEF